MSLPDPSTSTGYKFFQAILYALVFLTRLPVSRWLHLADEATAQRAIYCYPLVGAILGVLLALGAWWCLPLGANLAAAVVLVLWAGMTGALHLDGLADCMDAYYAGHKCTDAQQRRQRILHVMHDPACGAVAVVAVVLLLLLKWAALAALLSAASAGQPLTLLLLTLGIAPVLARSVILPFMTLHPYARSDGTVALGKHQSAPSYWGIALLVWALCGLLLGWWVALILAVALGTLMLLWARLWQRQIGGYTGDCLGALVELAETLVLIIGVALW
jgi:adenosylcobinamide-GDP ribazoletransferase